MNLQNMWIGHNYNKYEDPKQICKPSIWSIGEERVSCCTHSLAVPTFLDINGLHFLQLSVSFYFTRAVVTKGTGKDWNEAGGIVLTRSEKQQLETPRKLIVLSLEHVNTKATLFKEVLAVTTCWAISSGGCW